MGKKKEATVIAYKILTENGYSPYVRYEWPLPKGNKPGKWVHTEGKITLCQNGVHATTAKYISTWLGYGSSKQIYTIELKGDIQYGDNKIVARSGRLLRKLNITPELFEQANSGYTEKDQLAFHAKLETYNKEYREELKAIKNKHKAILEKISNEQSAVRRKFTELEDEAFRIYHKKRKQIQNKAQKQLKAALSTD